MRNPEDEFDRERIEIYRAQATELKLRYLEEANSFFEKIKDEKTKKINEKLKNRGF